MTQIKKKKYGLRDGCGLILGQNSLKRTLLPKRGEGGCISNIMIGPLDVLLPLISLSVSRTQKEKRKKKFLFTNTHELGTIFALKPIGVSHPM